MISRLTRYTAVPLLAVSLAACGGSAAGSLTGAPSASGSVGQPAAVAAGAGAAASAGSSPSQAAGAASGAGAASASPAVGTAAASAASSSTGANAAAPSGPAEAAAAGDVTISLGTTGNQVQIHATELLAGNAAKTQAVEKTGKVTGSIVLDASGQPASGSILTIDMTSLQSDRAIRDGFIQRETLNTRTYPTATFVPKQVQGLSGPLPTSGQLTFKLLGDMTVKDVTKPITWDVIAKFDGQTCSGTATTQFALSDFGMTPPKAGPVIAVDNNMTADVAFQANRTVA